MQEQERTTTQEAPTGRTWHRVARTMVAGSAIALGLVAANTSMAQASSTTAAGAHASTAASTDDDPPSFCAFDPACQPFIIRVGG